MLETYRGDVELFCKYFLRYMRENEKLIAMGEQERFSVFDIWERFGITEHMGGVYATRRLIERCGISPRQRILDIGCGTGYTACLLAKEYQADVVAIDITAKVLERTKERAAREGVSDKVKVMRADAQDIPFSVNTFDAVIAESVLVFCDKKKAALEVYRVLKPGGVFGDNEITFLKPPLPELTTLLSKFFGVNIQPLLEEKWRALFKEVGFDVSSAVYPINFKEQFASHLKVDGLVKYLSAIAHGILDPTVRSAFFNKIMLKATRQFLPYIGYGLYVNKFLS